MENADGEIVGKKPKARLIIKGYQDPDLLNLKRDSPALNNQNRNLIFSLAALFGWKIAAGDIKTAFLNGDKTESKRNIFADPPEEVRRMMGMKLWELFRIQKAAYGLLSLLHAPRAWYDKLDRVLSESGWVRSRIEPCVWRLYNPQKELCGIIGGHVDDLVCCGKGFLFTTKVDQLRNQFPFGSWIDAQQETITFCGCEISQKSRFQC